MIGDAPNAKRLLAQRFITTSLVMLMTNGRSRRTVSRKLAICLRSIEFIVPPQYWYWPFARCLAHKSDELAHDLDPLGVDGFGVVLG